MKRKAYMTDNLRGYLSKEGLEAMKRLTDAGIDRDLAFTMLESLFKEEDLYDIPEEDLDDN